MRKILKMVLVAALLASPLAMAENWMLRGRVIGVNPDESSSNPAVPVSVSNETVLEVDLSYFLTKNVALELIATRKSFDVSSAGASLGSVTLLPPTLLVQYHFTPEAKFRPYVGVGINYTRFSNRSLAAGTLEVDKDSTGAAIQVGVDIEIAKNLFLNLDLKKIQIDTDVKAVATGATVTNLKIDPLVFGVGIGWSF